MNKTLKKTLLKIARNAILEKFDEQYKIVPDELKALYPDLKNNQASFVTLLKDNKNETGELRGCIGSILAKRSLIDDIIHNAKAAAFHDPRFEPVLLNEVSDITIEISILSVPVKVNAKSYIEIKNIILPYKHGVIIRKGFNRAVFLPDVWKKLPDFDIFFNHLCSKAGLASDCISSLDEIEIFVVDKCSENEI